jgi:hypothetical protein
MRDCLSSSLPCWSARLITTSSSGISSQEAVGSSRGEKAADGQTENRHPRCRVLLRVRRRTQRGLFVTEKDAGRTSGPAGGAIVALSRADLVVWGAVALIVLGGFLGMWGYFQWEDAVPIPLVSTLSAKILSVVLVFTGGALLNPASRRRNGSEDANET